MISSIYSFKLVGQYIVLNIKRIVVPGEFII